MSRRCRDRGQLFAGEWSPNARVPLHCTYLIRYGIDVCQVGVYAVLGKIYTVLGKKWDLEGCLYENTRSAGR